MRERLSALVPRLKEAVDRRSAWPASDRGRFDEALRVLALDHAPDAYDSPRVGAPVDDPIAALAAVFALDDLDQDLLLVATAAEVDSTFALLFGLLRGTPGPARASVGLALELCGLASLDPRGMERLGASAALRRHGLLDVAPGAWLTREVSVPERVVAHLLTADVVDPDVAAIATHPVPLAIEGAELVARALETGAPLVWVRAAAGAAGPSLATAAFALAGIRCICVDLDRAGVGAGGGTGGAAEGGAGAGAAPDELVQRAVREAALLGAGLVLAGADRVVASALSALHASPVPVVAVARRAWDRAWPAPFPLCVDAPTLSPADRASAWLATGGSEVSGRGLDGLRLGPEAIAQTASYVRVLAAAHDVVVDADLVRHAARRVSGSTGSALAGSSTTIGAPRGGAVAARTSFGDLVLPARVEAPLRRLVGWARHRDEALSRGSLLDLGHKGAGLAALFTGGPGTGKTLAAHVVADELGVELVQVDLSTIVDKYIGETEKNLERVFSQAESLNVVLFFDEADALFGRRTEVKDSHDRHANQEVAYLLQRMENFDGLTILATNLRGNLDAAFSRRLNFVVHFPDPDVGTRRRLWALHLEKLGPLDPADPPDLDELAASVELAGGDIRNIVLAAGYDAAAAGHLPGMADVRAAATSEFQKLGRRPPAALTEPVVQG